MGKVKELNDDVVLDEYTSGYIKIVVQNIKRIRKKRKWTQAQLAEKANLSNKQIGNLEGQKVNFGIETLLSVAFGLDVYPGDLFKDSRKRPPSKPDPNSAGGSAEPRSNPRPQSQAATFRIQPIADQADPTPIRVPMEYNTIYKMFLESEWVPHEGNILEYGISGHERHGDEWVMALKLSSVSSDGAYVSDLVDKLNRNDVCITQFWEIMEDELGQHTLDYV